jgi:hypothetical protein
MPLDPVEFAPSDGLWDLVAVAADRGAARLADPAGWVLVVSERARRESAGGTIRRPDRATATATARL